MPRVVACPTPHGHCSGASLATNQSMRSVQIRYHQTHGDAYKCYVRYLKRVRGCADRGNREFKCPDRDSIIFLTKRSRFGQSFRFGKEKTRVMPRKNRGAVVSN